MISDRKTGDGETASSIFVPLWLLALLAFSGTLAMHIFVPALPVAAKDLQAGIPAMQMTISLYILGLAGGQLVYGPLADRFGRRPTLMGGLALYTAAGIAALLAPSVHALIAARLFQALGGCAGLALARAIVRDTSAPADTARRLALMNLMITVGPGVAPIIGGALADWAGWRSIFLLLVALGIANLFFTWRLLPETGGKSEEGLAGLIENYGALIRSPVFWCYAIGGGCATTSMYAFVAAAPFIFTNELHRPAFEVGIYLAILILGVWCGSMLASRLIGRVSMRRLLVVSNAAGALASFALLGAVLLGQLSVALAVITMFIFTVGVGTAAPAALTEAISVNPRVAGSASGLYGAIQMAVGALCTALAGFGSDPAFAAALVLAAASVIAQLAFAYATRANTARAA
ncbi:multidrug effflux MFS transporter [Aestuariivirga sp.]|uniref:multidrug effflux MFS transporter n=1 Tax=Aestuariivirga sp. TaxID=2650926 RepID=UPI0039E4B8A0